jgi:thymidylate synthase (FAD)
MKAELINHMGSDLTVVNAARVSFGAKSEKLSDKDKKLIKYLKAHEHDSVFEHCAATFLIDCDMATAMQIIRHRTFSYNMVSRRYTSEKIEFYTPSEFRKQAKNNRQASDGLIDDQEAATELFVQHYLACLEGYEKALAMGICREQARFLLPIGLKTQFYMSGNLRNWMHFLHLRSSEHAQQEVREIAGQIRAALMAYFPVSIEAFDEFQNPRWIADAEKHLAELEADKADTVQSMDCYRLGKIDALRTVLAGIYK